MKRDHEMTEIYNNIDERTVLGILSSANTIPMLGYVTTVLEFSIFILN